MATTETSIIEAAQSELDARFKQRLIPKSVYERACAEIERAGEPAASKWLMQSAEQLKPPSDITSSSLTDAQRICAEINERELSMAEQGDQIGYMTRAAIMATLPRSKSNKLSFKRTSGDYTLLMTIPQEAAEEQNLILPYGTIPRLIFLWLSTEVTLTRERTLYLGKHKTDFMIKTGLQPRTGKRGNMKMFEQQLNSLLFTSFSAWRKDGDDKNGSLNIHHRKIASDYQLWWNQERDGKFNGGILKLDHDFYTEMLNSGIPVNLNTIAALKDSSMALDIYIWLTYRFHTLRRPQPFPWEWLYNQFGGNEYGDNPEGRKSFKRNFIKALKKVLEHYTDANAIPKPAGLILHPSPTHVRLLKQ